jgi:hypothetical protein
MNAFQTSIERRDPGRGESQAQRAQAKRCLVVEQEYAQVSRCSPERAPTSGSEFSRSAGAASPPRAPARPRRTPPRSRCRRSRRPPRRLGARGGASVDGIGQGQRVGDRVQNGWHSPSARKRRSPVRTRASRTTARIRERLEPPERAGEQAFERAGHPLAKQGDRGHQEHRGQRSRAARRERGSIRAPRTGPWRSRDQR